MWEDLISIGILGTLGIALVYAIVLRVRDKKKENFEERDN
jgi:hypothetical protein